MRTSIKGGTNKSSKEDEEMNSKNLGMRDVAIYISSSIRAHMNLNIVTAAWNERKTGYFVNTFGMAHNWDPSDIEITYHLNF